MNSELGSLQSGNGLVTVTDRSVSWLEKRSEHPHFTISQQLIFSPQSIGVDSLC